jgi:hypothetical protein
MKSNQSIFNMAIILSGAYPEPREGEAQSKDLLFLSSSTTAGAPHLDFEMRVPASTTKMVAPFFRVLRGRVGDSNLSSSRNIATPNPDFKTRVVAL